MEEKSFLPNKFDWDEKNRNKNRETHKVVFTECEEIFFNDLLIIAGINKSKILYHEERYTAYGMTNSGRVLFVVFTIRSERIRVISARDMSKKERRFYHEQIKS